MMKWISLMSLILCFSTKAEVTMQEEFLFGKDRVSIHSIEIPKEEIFVTVEINQKIFLTTIRYQEEGGIDFFVDGYNSTLSEREKNLVAKAMKKYRPSRNFSRDAKYMVKGALMFLISAPEHYKHGRVEKREAQEFKGECVYDGETHTAYFTDRKRRVLSSTKTINIEKSEVGVCGSGIITTGWTKDCLTHDECQNTMRRLKRFELPGGTGPNCLDEFVRAIDDFFFSKWFWGCRGTR